MRHARLDVPLGLSPVDEPRPFAVRGRSRDMQRQLLAVVILFASAFTAFSGQAPASPVRVERAWMRQPAPTSGSAAVYAVVVNETDRPVTIVAATSPRVKTAELHRMSMHDGMMRMRPLEELVVPPRGRADLAPGGVHLMLFGVEGRLAPGDRLPIALKTADGTELPATVEVRAAESDR